MGIHTPGPWWADAVRLTQDPTDPELPQWKTDIRAVGGTAIEQALGATFIVAHVGSNPDDDECKANVHLVAAAPELLAACKLALDAGDQFYARSVIASAIAKAEGRTHEE